MTGSVERPVVASFRSKDEAVRFAHDFPPQAIEDRNDVYALEDGIVRGVVESVVGGDEVTAVDAVIQYVVESVVARAVTHVVLYDRNFQFAVRWGALDTLREMSREGVTSRLDHVEKAILHGIISSESVYGADDVKARAVRQLKAELDGRA